MAQTTESRRHSEGSSSLYCVIPPELSNLHQPLTQHFADDPRIEIVVERRRTERREGGDRRRGISHPPEGVERRLAEDLEGRRFGERRGPVVPVDKQPALPPELLPQAERVSFSKPVKPATPEQDLARMKALAAEWRNRCGDAMREATDNMLLSHTQGIEALVAALAARDSDTWEHSAAVVWLAVTCATELGLNEDDVAEVQVVALLHDIGKLGIPDSILMKTGPLSDDEAEVMRQHPAIGAQIVGSIDTLRHLAPAIRAEHERWDGLGYPDGLAGEQIPLPSRITFVCDSYHAMISDRPYRKAVGPREACRVLADTAGRQFCPDAAAALLRVLGEPQAA